MIPRGFLDRLAAEHGVTKTSLTVRGGTTDPLRVDQWTNHTIAAWFRDELERIGFDCSPVTTPGERRRTIHNRGSHYALLGRPKPNGETYTNTAENDDWLSGTASKAARWLEDENGNPYVPFEVIADERNAEPVIRWWSRSVPHGFAGVGTGSIPGLDDFSPEAFLTGFDGVQPYHLAIIGEKSSLDPVLGPLAEEYRADLYLPTGHISDSYLYDLARISAVDGRPLRIFYVHDCDPYGFDMARTVAYKVGLLVMFGFPGLDAQLYRVALTPDQVKDLGLPSAPFGDEGTTRRDKWRAAWGIDQTEVDALATAAAGPGADRPRRPRRVLRPQPLPPRARGEVTLAG